MARADLQGLSGKAKVGAGGLAIGLVVALDGCLNMMGLSFRGADFLDAILGESPVTKIAVGFALIVVGGVIFRLGGGKEHFERQQGRARQ